MTKFSHLNKKNEPTMIDVGSKEITKRSAVAEASMYLGNKVVTALQENDLNSKKGPVFQTAIIAGIQGVKKTSDLIPMCHPLPLNGISIDIEFIDDVSILIQCRVNMEGKTGVEMEALTGASLTALTIYDMCKSLSQKMRIEQVRLVEKKGGKSDINLRKSIEN